MEKKFYYNELYDYYKELLTDKQKEYYESYYFDDYSLAEIAGNENVSRNAVFNQVKIVLERLDFYEEKLNLYKNGLKIKEYIKDLDENLKEKIEELI